ncbi:MAG: hypothetical protein E6Q69_03605 [Aquipseudomonas alcaligenes]|uniref:Uncharacterized protein n=1 Tax=Aquipseudomonas alcaligenes TaxID=43263 RepID=A0A5C7WDC9_AQUAC|nr:MAG: hypothetical protein E6Q69_03605 [Pseudomonas alcaligenes]
MPSQYFVFLRRVFVTLFLICLAGLDGARAAEISYPKSGSGRQISGVLIEGPIVAGDFDKFEYMILNSEAEHVFLASPGGNLLEAMKIGELIRKMKLSVVAPEENQEVWSIMVRVRDPANNVCASACFFIYAGGVNRSGEVLGIHRPRITDDALRSASLDQAASGLASINEVASAYLRKMGIPYSVIDKMNSVNPEDMHWLSEEDFRSLSGYIPEYQDWLDAKCPSFEIGLRVQAKPCEGCSVDEMMRNHDDAVENEIFACKEILISLERIDIRQKIIDEYFNSGRLKELIEKKKVWGLTEVEPEGGLN